MTASPPIRDGYRGPPDDSWSGRTNRSSRSRGLSMRSSRSSRSFSKLSKSFTEKLFLFWAFDIRLPVDRWRCSAIKRFEFRGIQTKTMLMYSRHGYPRLFFYLLILFSLSRPLKRASFAHFSDYFETACLLHNLLKTKNSLKSFLIIWSFDLLNNLNTHQWLVVWSSIYRICRLLNNSHHQYACYRKHLTDTYHWLPGLVNYFR